MKAISFQAACSNRRCWWLLAAVLLVVVTGLAAAGRWFPEIKHLATSAFGASASHSEAESADAAHAGEAPGAHAGEAPDAHAGEALDAHAGEAPDAHAGEAAADPTHDPASMLQLSRAAQENVGLRLAKIELKPFERTMAVPAVVVERPGRSTLQIAAPLTGVVTRIFATQGESVNAGQPLFELRLTHEELLESQGEFLRVSEELEVVRREIERLETITANGAIAGKTLLERKYEQQKLEATLHSQRQRLLLHGLSSSQVDRILADRTLLGSMTVSVPEAAASKTAPRPLQVQALKVETGQAVVAGAALCVLADYAELSIEGRAFEQDAAVLDKAVANDWPVAAMCDCGAGGRRETVANLKIAYLADKIDPESRVFSFFVRLPNKLVRSRQTEDGRQFADWQFRPGQRVQVLVPVERWTGRIVLPIDSVVQDGAELYVFEEHDGHFDRRAVRVEYRDQNSVVIANDGVLKPGTMVVVSGAYQAHLALKNKSGGAPDPHAGHNH
jgi:membrane fusion protein, heavy metal efflux system